MLVFNQSGWNDDSVDATCEMIAQRWDDPDVAEEAVNAVVNTWTGMGRPAWGVLQQAYDAAKRRAILNYPALIGGRTDRPSTSNAAVRSPPRRTPRSAHVATRTPTSTSAVRVPQGRTELGLLRLHRRSGQEARNTRGPAEGSLGPRTRPDRPSDTRRDAGTPEGSCGDRRRVRPTRRRRLHPRRRLGTRTGTTDDDFERALLDRTARRYPHRCVAERPRRSAPDTEASTPMVERRTDGRQTSRSTRPCSGSFGCPPNGRRWKKRWRSRSARSNRK